MLVPNNENFEMEIIEIEQQILCNEENEQELENNE
jgi:hypothetical protein